MTPRPTSDRFDRLTEALAPGRSDFISAGWLSVLLGLYGEPRRAYHHLGHIENLLARLDILPWNEKPGFDRRLETEVAIWFHDAVYVVGSKTNEEASALLARAFLFSLGAANSAGNRGAPDNVPFVDKVQAAIMATKHDGRPADGNAARVMVDLDLAGFADPWEMFEMNNQRIREEYAQYTDDQYRWGRINFLTGLLGRRIFNVMTELEAPGRANIERHIGELVAATPKTEER